MIPPLHATFLLCCTNHHHSDDDLTFFEGSLLQHSTSNLWPKHAFAAIIQSAFSYLKNSPIENSEFLVLCNDTSQKSELQVELVISSLLGRQLGSYSLLLPCRARRDQSDFQFNGCGIFLTIFAICFLTATIRASNLQIYLFQENQF